MRRRAVAGFAVAVCAVLGGGGAGVARAGDAKHPEKLETLLKEFADARISGKDARAREIMLSLIPTKADLEQACRKGADTDAFLAKHEPKDFQPDDPRIQSVLPPVSDEEKKRTEVRVHAATTEDLAKYEKGSTAWAEFPGGMQRFAQKVAAPGRTWFCAEFLEPGKDAGMKFTCFTRVGDRFVFVVKPWRSIPETK